MLDINVKVIGVHWVHFSFWDTLGYNFDFGVIGVHFSFWGNWGTLLILGYIGVHFPAPVIMTTMKKPTENLSELRTL